MEVSLNKKALALTLVLTVVITFGLTPAAQAVMGFDLMSILKLFGIGYVVKQFGPQINEAINTLAFSRKWETKDVTKVVPILSGELSTSGSGAYIGAAQVSGPQEQVDKVQAVAVQTPNFGHYAAITSGFKSFLMIALWYSLGGLSLRLP